MFSVPPKGNPSDSVCVAATQVKLGSCECVVPLDKYSSFGKLCRVVHYVRKFVGKLKENVAFRNNGNFSDKDR